MKIPPLVGEVEALRVRLVKARADLGAAVQPLESVAVESQTTAIEILRQLSFQVQPRIDSALLFWLETGEWPEMLLASDEWWLAERLDHAVWLLDCLTDYDPETLSEWYPFLPQREGRMVPGFAEFLLVLSWGVGLQRMLREMARVPG